MDAGPAPLPGVAPVLRYPPELPVSARRDDIAAAIEAHPVVVVAGETGSGKTTQLPKICLELGRGRGLGDDGALLGHTQPRRIAARSVSARLAEELGTTLGGDGLVGYAVRFDDRVGPNTRVKVMTDGILLAEVHRDRDLRAYDTVIVDEAHERSLTIDFLLGYLHGLLRRRDDLKVVITSATIDPQRMADHFGGAPVVEVSGRTWPVEVRYRPLDGGDGRALDQVEGICAAVEELWTEPDGDILVFLSGEREIRDAQVALAERALPGTEVLPLYARLPLAEQRRIFAPHPAGVRRRVVLATNVAETSLTVPGIRYVVDPGTARTSRYSPRLKVQRLPIESVSQASAAQRAGRCGRVAPGVCIRLYDEDDFAARPAFTEPEVLRTNLASVILQMAELGLGDVAAFPFIDPPDRRAVTDGLRLLHELGAVAGRDQPAPGTPVRLTKLGRRLARLPVDPRLARMLVEADRNGSLHDVLVVVAALAIDDPRERPAERRGEADALHRARADAGSDVLSYLRLWHDVREAQRSRSGNQFRRWCREQMLSYLRVREWQDLHSQLRRAVAGAGMHPSRGEAHPDAVHRAVLAGLLTQIGRRDDTARRDEPTTRGAKPGGSPRRRPGREYVGVRGSRFAIFPGSPLAADPPPWIMAAELVETSRLWARTVARIDPAWVEPLAPHLVRRRHGEPEWSADRGAATVLETVSLGGLALVEGRRVGLARVDPALARELFVRHALVAGDWPGAARHPVLAANDARLADLERLEHRFRRDDLVPDDDQLCDLYLERVPTDVVSGQHFDRWRRTVAAVQGDDPLALRAADLVAAAGSARAVAALDGAAFPLRWRDGDLDLPVTYRFDPGADDDGVTVHVPVDVLNRVSPRRCTWQVPGLRTELVVSLLRLLPKDLRRALGPVGGDGAAAEATTAEALAGADPDADDLLDVLSRFVARRTGRSVPRAAWAVDELADHLRLRVVVHDERGEVLAAGRDVAVLAAQLGRAVRDRVASGAAVAERHGLHRWELGELPERTTHERGGRTVVAFPALVDEGDAAGVRVFASLDEAAEHHWAGVRRLLAIAVAVPERDLVRRLERGAGAAMAANPYPSAAAAVRDAERAVLDRLLGEAGTPRDATAFDRLVARARAEVPSAMAAQVDALVEVLQRVAAIDRTLRSPAPPTWTVSLDDIAAQRGALVYDGFVAAAGADRTADVARYLHAIEVRLDALGRDVGRDQQRLREVERLEARYGHLTEALPHHGRTGRELERLGWLLEELRVSVFAQRLGTREPVSVARVERALDDLARG